ncbi:PGF-pre-PGF domain-containing protein [Methanoregula sp.]|jgi:PGF-pre-PGF domain-containing protein|uniref:PGF-pre-PGF domain-containing protein n=1 Tax=Methanoregula sp. TaxID=2052170 RepID=UPI003C150854
MIGLKRYGLVLVGLLLIALAAPVAATDWTLNPTDSIQANISLASPGDTLILNPGTYYQNGITVDRNIIIRANTSYGHSATDTIIDGGNAAGIMTVNGGVTLTIDNLTLQNGNAVNGAAIHNSGTLTITSSMFSGCTATNYGGAIENSGTITGITSSTFSGCTATHGGAIENYNTGLIISISSSTFSLCTATGSIASNPSGGAIENRGTITSISSTTFSGCTATDMGGAIETSGTSLTITSSTFSGCTATYGGAINNSGTSLTITSSTFTGCSANQGGAIDIEPLPFSASMHFCRIVNCNAGIAVNNFGIGTFDIKNNWWGTNAEPSAYYHGPSSDYTPWLMLGTSATPVSITTAQNSAIDANLTYDSGGTHHIPAPGSVVPDGIPVIFSSTSGAVAPTSGSMVSAANTTLFTPSGGGTSTISATVDGQTVSVPVTVTGPAFTGSPTSGTAPLPVTFTDASTGSPTMWNWSFGDGQWSNNTVTTNPVHTYAGAGTFTVSLTVTLGGTPYTLTRAGYITVNAVPVIVPTAIPTTATGAISGGDNSPPPVIQGQLSTVSVNVGGTTPISSASVTGTGLGDLVVTSTQADGPGTGVPLPPGTVYEYMDITPAAYGTITGAQVSFTVPQSWLDENKFTPQDIVLYHNTGNGWQALVTSFVKSENGEDYFTATTPGFSRFAITGNATRSAGSPDPTPSPTVLTIGDLAGSPATEPPTFAPLSLTQTPTPIPVTTTTPRAGLDTIPVVGALVVCGAIFLFRKNGN